MIAKHADLELDAVVALGPQALAFAAETVTSFAGNMPVLFGGVTRASVEHLELPSNFGGVVATFDVAGTVRLARRLQPTARRVIVLSGSAGFDRSWEASAREALAVFDDLQVEYVSGLAIEGFESLAAGVEADRILIVQTIFEDADGERFIPRDAAARIAAQAAAPV